MCVHDLTDELARAMLIYGAQPRGSRMTAAQTAKHGGFVVFNHSRSSNT